MGIEFNLILKAAGKPISAAMFWKLLIGTVAMLGFGYAGETGAMNPAAGFACGEAGGTAGDCSAAVKSNFETMRFIVSIGWAIYPLGYFLGVLSSCQMPRASSTLSTTLPTS